VAGVAFMAFRQAVRAAVVEGWLWPVWSIRVVVMQ
jgi:hypothetical protein